MDKQELIEELEEMKCEKDYCDSEAAHTRADRLLLQWFEDNGHEEVKEAYEVMRNSYNWWSYA